MPAIQKIQELFSGRFYLGKKKKQSFHSKSKMEGIYHLMETPLK